MHPLGRLNPPGNYDELVTDSVTDVLPGVVGWINDGVAWATRQFGHEVNVVQWLTEAVGGDWGALLSLADAWNNLAWASSDIGTNLVRGLTELNPYWDGNAAQAFEAHMSKWYGAFSQNQALCENVRDTLRELASVAKEFLQAAIDMIQMLFSILARADSPCWSCEGGTSPRVSSRPFGCTTPSRRASKRQCQSFR